MDFKKYIKEAHGNAVDRGFYDCPKCDGEGYVDWDIIASPNMHPPEKHEICAHCNGTGIDPNRNIGELLMLIVADIGKAATLWDDEISKHHCEDIEFSGLVYFEEKLADVFIRLFDLAGYLKYDIGDDLIPQTHQFQGSVGEFFFCRVIKALGRISVEKADTTFESDTIRYVIEILLGLCESMNIPIEKHIQAKMAYNRTRPRKHGKRY